MCLASGLLSAGCSGASSRRFARQCSGSGDPPVDGLEQRTGGEVHLLLFLHAPGLVASGHREPCVSVCHQINTGWVGVQYAGVFL